MIICIEKSTGKLIEMQSKCIPGTLIRNAVVSGYSAEQVEERVVSEVEFRAIWEDLPEIVSRKEVFALREQAITENIPSWQQVSDAIDAATTIAACKVILKKLARVVYWLAKNKND